MAKRALKATVICFSLAASMSLMPEGGRTETSQNPDTSVAPTVSVPAAQATTPSVQAAETTPPSALPTAKRVTLLSPLDGTPTIPTTQPAETTAPPDGPSPATVPAAVPLAIAEPESQQSAPTPLTEVVLRLGERFLYVKRDGAVIAKFPVAIGAPETPTPKGTFQITSKLKDPIYESTQSGRRSKVVGPNSPIGDRWIGFHHTGNDQFGFHGTPWPYWVDVRGAVSHGCVRLKNEHVRKLYELISVGDTVRVTE